MGTDDTLQFVVIAPSMGRALEEAHDKSVRYFGSRPYRIVSSYSEPCEVDYAGSSILFDVTFVVKGGAK